MATQQASHPLCKGVGRHECFLFTFSMLRDTQSIVWVRILEAVWDNSIKQGTMCGIFKYVIQIS